jgi:hypothetical protein
MAAKVNASLHLIFNPGDVIFDDIEMLLLSNFVVSVHRVIKQQCEFTYIGVLIARVLLV